MDLKEIGWEEGARSIWLRKDKLQAPVHMVMNLQVLYKCQEVLGQLSKYYIFNDQAPQSVSWIWLLRWSIRPLQKLCNHKTAKKNMDKHPCSKWDTINYY
jgi:hypothetical protein